MPLSPAETAALRAFIEKAGDEHSLALIAAACAMHGLLSGGAREAQKPDAIAREAWECGDAFLVETMYRLLPQLRQRPSG